MSLHAVMVGYVLRKAMRTTLKAVHFASTNVSLMIDIERRCWTGTEAPTVQALLSRRKRHWSLGSSKWISG